MCFIRYNQQLSPKNNINFTPKFERKILSPSFIHPWGKANVLTLLFLLFFHSPAHDTHTHISSPIHISPSTHSHPHPHTSTSLHTQTGIKVLTLRTSSRNTNRSVIHVLNHVYISTLHLSLEFHTSPSPSFTFLPSTYCTLGSHLIFSPIHRLGDPKFAPTFSKKPAIRQEEDGSKLLFECKIKSNPKPEVCWEHEGTRVESKGRFKVSDLFTGAHHLEYFAHPSQLTFSPCTLIILVGDVQEQGQYFTPEYLQPPLILLTVTLDPLLSHFYFTPSTTACTLTLLLVLSPSFS